MNTISLEPVQIQLSYQSTKYENYFKDFINFNLSLLSLKNVIIGYVIIFSYRLTMIDSSVSLFTICARDLPVVFTVFLASVNSFQI